MNQLKTGAGPSKLSGYRMLYCKRRSDRAPNVISVVHQSGSGSAW